MMFYKEKEEPELREELFENPGAAYRGAPFWAWNKKLNKKELVDQVEQFKKNGNGWISHSLQSGAGYGISWDRIFFLCGSL